VIFILTGAGISAPSGIQTFRASDGLWNGHRVEEVATPKGFELNPNLVLDFYNKRRADLFNVQPNSAHEALANYAKSEDYDLTLVTQNVDDLHERGGVKDVIHMHGELRKIRCQGCSQVFEWYEDLILSDKCESCGEKMRPHIVWFGEIPFQMQEIYEALEQCDLFLCIGTSGNVYPAADFVNIARTKGAHTVEFNLEKTSISGSFDECIIGDVVETVSKWVSGLNLI